ncbi:Uncharacterised protein [Providencia rustigianii]|nr:Uncharacterised protein [Providencia rustigianii]
MFISPQSIIIFVSVEVEMIRESLLFLSRKQFLANK